jgi:hypothetical protein
VLVRAVRIRQPTACASGGRTVAYVPDHGPLALGPGRTVEAVPRGGADPRRGADLLLHDAQFTTEDLATKATFGPRRSTTPSPWPSAARSGSFSCSTMTPGAPTTSSTPSSTGGLPGRRSVRKCKATRSSSDGAHRSAIATRVLPRRLGRLARRVALTTAVYERTGSASWVAACVAMRFVPGIAVGPLAGVLADKMDRRLVIVGSCCDRRHARPARRRFRRRGAAALLVLAVVDSTGPPYRPAAWLFSRARLARRGGGDGPVGEPAGRGCRTGGRCPAAGLVDP